MKRVLLIVVALLPALLFAQLVGERNEIAPGQKEFTGTRANGDIIWSLDVETITQDYQCVGAEFDGTFLWISGGNSGSDPNKLYKIDPYTATLVNTYEVPSQVAGWGLRDLAWIGDDGLLYGGWENGFLSFDPVTETFNELFTGQSFGTIRALAWDGSYFWTKSFSAALVQFDISGTLQSSYPAPEAASAYGAACDWHEGYLYIFDQSNAVFLQYMLDGTYTGLNYDVSSFPGTEVAGGAFYDYGELVPGKATLCGLIQGTPDTVIAVELYNSSTPEDIPLSPWAIGLAIVLIAGLVVGRMVIRR